ncbi:MAG: T9SS type A sorting domain-containing protein [Cryomorphaceae bacterium]|nr:T9SS type A sorting domain-containing protein [Flavobacteriales bacterium]
MIDMKNFFIHIAIFVFAVSVSLSSSAQDGTVQLQFSATEVQGKVYLDWTMNLGQTCNGIDITRSTDGLNFSPIGNIAGICGSSFESVSYFFVDESPVPNQVNYYRLTLGNLGPSQTLSVEVIDLEGAGYQVRPNPIVDNARVYFDNDRSAEHRFTLFSENGKSLLTGNTRRDFFEINATGLAEGIYIFRIETADGSEKASGRVVVAR